MNILLISECSKQALVETRRVLDQFGERKGQRCWQTPITYEGMKTLRMLLKTSARKNTAVACYRIYGKNHTELMWVVGKRSKFNLEGTVPTNRTQRDIIRAGDESNMHSNQAIALMASIAGLFHDFGKANALFQAKLRGKGDGYEPYRHEWISMQLFLAFVANRDDKTWLNALCNLTANGDETFLKNVELSERVVFAEIATYSPLAAAIAWLIMSHHRLPQQQNSDSVSPEIHAAERWFNQGIGVEWNAVNHLKFTEVEKQQCNKFPFGLPFQSRTWRAKATSLATRALQLPSLGEYARLKLAYPMHVARMVLMLADHTYSSDVAHEYWQDPDYQAYANTNRKTKTLKQKLDEHCVGVAHNAYRLAKVLPSLRSTLPTLIRHPKLKKRVSHPRFRWQNRAYEVLTVEKHRAQEKGLFAVLASSTGTGKTIASAKMAYALGDQQQGCRFNIALGLRTLTLQTGDALKETLSLDNDDIAVTIGSQAVKDLYDHNKKGVDATKESTSTFTGSESQQMFDDDYVKYDGELDNTYLNRWLKDDSRANLHKLISAPISVSTIDRLIPATEGVRGGRQIGPMLRLMTSDLILDEPDDFDIADLPALCRLVYWAGLLGSRVILSSATLPPALVCDLFDAYLHGRTQFNAANGFTQNNTVVAAWVDEFNATSDLIADKKTFQQRHSEFVNGRVKQLVQASEPLHRGRLIKLENENANPVDAFARAILHHSQQLARHHHTIHGGKTFSAGLVRMANIEPMLAVANTLFSLSPETDTRIHYCVYHSQHPLLVRSALEHELDSLLKRAPQRPITDHPKVKQMMSRYPEKHHLFVVLATPVAEVGRDHDYDWAIAEPSSMRSIIQLSGRVQRHRRIIPKVENILVLNKNFKACQNQCPAYYKPGFESENTYLTNTAKPHTEKQWLKLPNHDLTDPSLLPNDAFGVISAAPRVQQPEVLYRKETMCTDSFIALEHLALNFNLRDKGRVWWASEYAHLFGEIQRQTQFRKSTPSIEYIVDVDENYESIALLEWDDLSEEFIDSDKVQLAPSPIQAEGISAFGESNLLQLLEQLTDESEIELKSSQCRYSTINLRELTGKKWLYSPLLGFFEGKYFTP
ncbi:type I-F CRISPR-associated helicase Cas3f [Photobacterium lutimaris]|uniref:Type I-F CRISPR-associated helicase Cas3 n=1 Tax=Photobacterium lutimaris TaxID=388278 RepID=A0A2T3J4S3_9GAMM|nr:type I-F CRISPR-associated helicase Cas3f [Photobacterium lutimaris]PSU36285.1 type I-F CRISPR-associated helicase Cas3 [Photobacterium lutimaris]TDR74831.1 CRISPR-associated Cas3 family helicase [Photobacterium lutimaris]